MISVITHNSISWRAFERSDRVYLVRLWVRRLLLWDFPRLSWKSKWNCIISSHWSLVPLIRFLWFHIIKTALELVFVCERQKASAWKIQFSSSRLVFIWTIESTCSALHTYYDILGRSLTVFSCFNLLLMPTSTSSILPIVFMQIQFNVYFQDNSTFLCFIAVKLLLMNDSQVMLQDICYNCANGNTKNWRTQMQFMQFNSFTINQKQQACGSWRKARVKTKEQTSSANKSKWEKAKYKTGRKH